MKKTFRVISLILVAFLIAASVVFTNKKDAYADDTYVTLAIWPQTAEVGDYVTCTITVSGDSVGQYSFNLNYTTSMLETISGSDGIVYIQGNGATSVSFTFKAIAEGTASFTTSPGEFYNANGEKLSVMQAGGQLPIGKAAIDETTEAETEEEQTEQTQDDGIITIGDKKYTLVNEFHLYSHPQDYTQTSVTYKGNEIFAYKAPNQNIKVVCLQNEEWEQKWFVYNEDSESFSPYVEYKMEGLKFIIINKPDDEKLPEGFSETDLVIDDVQITAYKNDYSDDMYLVYALNPTGLIGAYYYDTTEGTLVRYNAIKDIVDSATATNAAAVEEDKKVENEEATTAVKYATPLIPEAKEKAEEDEGFLNKDMLKKLLMMMIAIFVVLCIVIIILIVKNSILQNKLYGDEDDEDDDEDEGGAIIKQQEEKPLSQTEELRRSKNTSYSVNEDTGEILLEEAEDNNAGINVPPAEEAISNIEKAMKERPYGVDSAFDVVPAEQLAASGSETDAEPVVDIAEETEEVKAAEDAVEDVADDTVDEAIDDAVEETEEVKAAEDAVEDVSDVEDTADTTEEDTTDEAEEDVEEDIHQKHGRKKNRKRSKKKYKNNQHEEAQNDYERSDKSQTSDLERVLNDYDKDSLRSVQDKVEERVVEDGFEVIEPEPDEPEPEKVVLPGQFDEDDY